MSRNASGRWVWGPLLVVVMGGASWAYFRAQDVLDRAIPDRARRLGRPIPVRTAEVTRGPVEQVIGATALTVPSEAATIQIWAGHDREFKVNDSTSDVVIKAVHVHEGDAVRRGQLLFELEDGALRHVVRYREKALAVAEAKRDFHAEDVKHRRRVADIFGKSYWEKRVADITQMDDAQAKYAFARAEQAAAEQLVEAATADLEVARRDLERARIASPIDGVVGAVDIVPGAVVGLTSVLTRVLKLDPIHVRVDLPQERIDDVQVGQAAEVVLDSLPEETFHGTVIRIAPEVTPEVRVLPVTVEMPNPGGRIKAGTSGFVRLRSTRTTTVVPTTAIIREGGKAMAFGVEGGRARLREVRTGPLVRTGMREVRDGLAPGEEVVVFHNFYRRAGKLIGRGGYLQDHDPVDTDWRRWAGRE